VTAAEKAAAALADQLREQIRADRLPAGHRFPSDVELGIFYRATERTSRLARDILLAEELIVPDPNLHDVYLIAGPDLPVDHDPRAAPAHDRDPRRRRDPLHTRPSAGLQLDGARSAQRTLRTLLADHQDGMDETVRAGIQSALSDLSRTVLR
jgi:DNA-binding transcriptional MocR family regulator